jgi:alpha,alpha-trehalose-phosphate synthase [UDP-forming]/trehalose-phosphatase
MRFQDLQQLVRSPRLGLILDLDGTLVPFASSPDEARLDRPTAEVLRMLAALEGVTVLVASGRTRVSIEPLVDSMPYLLWAAEHGGWRHDGRAWAPLETEAGDLTSLHTRLVDVACNVHGTRIERKRSSICLHWRNVAATEQEALIAAAGLVIDEWLEEHEDYESLPAVAAVEVRRIGTHKGTAVAWLRTLLGAGARLLALGDDLTDEDAFAALGSRDLAVLVARRQDRPTRAAYRVDDPEQVQRLLRWIAAMRVGATEGLPPPVSPVRRADAAQRAGLLIVSNRLPTVQAGQQLRTREVGGLVGALAPALADTPAVWLGWSGEYRDGPTRLDFRDDLHPPLAQFDHPTHWRQLYYGGFCNRSLWPLLHGFPSRVRYLDAEWECYLEVNQAYAFAARSIAGRDTPVWLHDYHLMLVADGLRQAGHRGRLGFFLHVPFPSLDVFATVPWSRELLRGLLAHDLVGVQTVQWRVNLVAAAAGLMGARPSASGVTYDGREIAIEVLPVGVDVEAFAPTGVISLEVASLRASLGERRLILGVDRLDYSKGIPERLTAFGRLLETSPEWRGRVSMIQVSVPSRAEVPEYAELRRHVENLVGRINGEFGEADWVPVRYLYRSYDAPTLAELYRAADVALVTPLCDGMNLVAKEFVAAQDPDDPGVLVLSRFAGAADELRAALLSNPYHADGLARDIEIALRMPLEECQRRHATNLAVVRTSSASAWARSFLARLAGR